MDHVFITYSRDDEDFAWALKARIERVGHAAWMDKDGLSTGEDWRGGIDDAIREAFVVVAVMTPAAASSEYVTYEWAFALGLGFRVIPLLVGPAKMHPRLGALHCLDCTDPRSRDWEGFFTLLEKARAQHSSAGPKLPRDTPVVIQQAAAKLDSLDAQERTAAVTTLKRTEHAVARQVLIDAVRHPVSDVRKAAIEALNRIGDAVAPVALHKALRDADGNVRHAAAKALGRAGGGSAVPLLREVLRDRSRDVRQAAVEALGRIGGEGAAAALRGAWRDRRVEVHLQDIVDALGQAGPAALPVMRDVLVTRLGQMVPSPELADLHMER